MIYPNKDNTCIQYMHNSTPLTMVAISLKYSLFGVYYKINWQPWGEKKKNDNRKCFLTNWPWLYNNNSKETKQNESKKRPTCDFWTELNKFQMRAVRPIECHGRWFWAKVFVHHFFLYQCIKCVNCQNHTHTHFDITQICFVDGFFSPQFLLLLLLNFFRKLCQHAVVCAFTIYWRTKTCHQRLAWSDRNCPPYSHWNFKLK